MEAIILGGSPSSRPRPLTLEIRWHKWSFYGMLGSRQPTRLSASRDFQRVMAGNPCPHASYASSLAVRTLMSAVVAVCRSTWFALKFKGLVDPHRIASILLHAGSECKIDLERVCVCVCVRAHVCIPGSVALSLSLLRSSLPPSCVLACLLACLPAFFRYFFLSCFFLFPSLSLRPK